MNMKERREKNKAAVQEHTALWNMCESCLISDWAFKKANHDGAFVPYWLFIGEGPGVSEDALGQPFVGASGRLLREALDLAGFPHSAYAFSNLVACRPTDGPQGGNRAPTAGEIENCDDRLRGLINILKPKVLIGVGKVSAEWLADQYNLPMRSIYHPAYILRQGGRKSEAFEHWLDELVKIKEGTR